MERVVRNLSYYFDEAALHVFVLVGIALAIGTVLRILLFSLSNKKVNARVRLLNTLKVSTRQTRFPKGSCQRDELSKKARVAYTSSCESSRSHDRQCVGKPPCMTSN